MNKEEAIKKAHNMYAYEISEQADMENNDFDALWQSIYDVLQVATYGIVDMEQDEIDEAMQWLRETQSMTTNYKETEIWF
ncbi:MAG: hypothetical protein LUG60_01320 [Erysipelotrichaceae bacterium]|nr:hypothetical protein [Erysipelotrichaceae bacterium]